MRTVLIPFYGFTVVNGGRAQMDSDVHDEKYFGSFAQVLYELAQNLSESWRAYLEFFAPFTSRLTATQHSGTRVVPHTVMRS